MHVLETRVESGQREALAESARGEKSGIIKREREREQGALRWSLENERKGRSGRAGDGAVG